MARDTRDIEKGEKCKTKTIITVYQHNKDNKVFYFYFLFMEKDIFCSKIEFRETQFILLHFQYSFVQCCRIFKTKMKHQLPYRQICIGFVDVVLSPRIFGNRVGILTSVFTAMGYFFRGEKSTFNLKNNICICQRSFSVYHVTGSTYFRIIFRAMCISRTYTKLSKGFEKINFYRS